MEKKTLKRIYGSHRFACIDTGEKFFYKAKYPFELKYIYHTHMDTLGYDYKCEIQTTDDFLYIWSKKFYLLNELIMKKQFNSEYDKFIEKYQKWTERYEKVSKILEKPLELKYVSVYKSYSSDLFSDNCAYELFSFFNSLEETLAFAWLTEIFERTKKPTFYIEPFFINNQLYKLLIKTQAKFVLQVDNKRSIHESMILLENPKTYQRQILWEGVEILINDAPDHIKKFILREGIKNSSKRNLSYKFIIMIGYYEYDGMEYERIYKEYEKIYNLLNNDK